MLDLVAWPGTSSSPVVDLAARWRLGSWSGSCRGSRPGWSWSTTSTSCSTRRSCRRPRRGRWSRATSSRRCARSSSGPTCGSARVVGHDPAAQDGRAAHPRGRDGAASLRPAAARARLGLAGAAGAGPLRARDRLQEPRRRDLAAQPRDRDAGGSQRDRGRRRVATSCSPTSSSAAATPASRRWPSCRTSPPTRSRAIRAPACTGCAGSWSRRADRVLPEIDAELAEYALRELRGRGIDIRLGTTLEEVRADSARLSTGETLPTRTVVWTAGVAPHPSLRRLSRAARRARARAGRRPPAGEGHGLGLGDRRLRRGAGPARRPLPADRPARGAPGPGRRPQHRRRARDRHGAALRVPRQRRLRQSRPLQGGRARSATAPSAASPPGGWHGPTT